MTTVYLDPGHGGTDPGATGNGIKEKDIVLDVCMRIKSGLLNNYQNVKVLMSRETDVFLSLAERTTKANNANANVLVSVHINAATATTARGFETFRYTNVNERTIAFQNVLHQEILKSMGSGITDRGKKTANFHMVKASKMEAILTENLFISNSTDAKLLSDPNFRQKIAQGHINGLERFLGLKKIQQPTQQPATDGKLYRVQVGAFSDKKNADALAADLTRLGYRPYVKYE